MNRLIRLLFNPPPYNIFLRKILQKFKIGNYKFRYTFSALERPYYGYIVYQAAALAKALDYKKISVIEFGVGQGNGLINLERQVKEISRIFDINIDIYGFDTAAGLPPPKDYRDCPYLWSEGSYKMDEDNLRSKLKDSKLILGNISETSKTFFEDYNPAPIGAVIYDFDFYSSTVPALKMLEKDSKYYLPRVFSYFDNTLGINKSCLNDFTGERLAINEFNQDHEKIKIAQPYDLINESEYWYKQIWVTHFFEHKDYCTFIRDKMELTIHRSYWYSTR